MRPHILSPLFAPVTSLAGIGPRIGKRLEQLAGEHVVDLLWHLPRSIIDRRYSPTIDALVDGDIATITAFVDEHRPPANKRQPYRVQCHDETGQITLNFFHLKTDYLERILPPGSERIVSGTIETFRGELQITHPDYVLTQKEFAQLPRVEPVYPLTAGLSLRVLGKVIRNAVETAPALPEWLDSDDLVRREWPGWLEAVQASHAPEEMESLLPSTPARMRLAFDELLANQLALGLMRIDRARRGGYAVKGDGRMRRIVRNALPFKMTKGQEEALRDITSDMEKPEVMLRLLQGDVGSGKTLVGLFAMLNAVECGGQAALMAPTEILVHQHETRLREFLQGTCVTVASLTGGARTGRRREVETQLASGEIDIVVGTHALFQKTVQMQNLMVAIIDEQHRFGVHQRLQLAAKGKTVDTLVMTATPIPRTLELTAYGDMDISRLKEKPAGRKEIDTRAVPLDRTDELLEAIGRVLETARVYWICPLIEDSEKSDLAAAARRHEELQARFGRETVALVHGRMKTKEKDAAMAAFAEGPARLLVATTVVEVGVDVPEATVMVIEHAERFGLAQIHQLRGRVGRSDRQSTCFLHYDQNSGEKALKRLRILRDTTDGFLIAEEDLKLRGGGEVLGTRQSGLPEFRLAELGAHQGLLVAATEAADRLLKQYPSLEGDRGEALRVLLYLFERNTAVLTLRSG